MTRRAASRAIGPAIGVTSIALVAALVLTVRSGLRNDYALYVRIWDFVLDGADPWRSDAFNAYGPAFNAIAPLTAIGDLTPKVMFTLTWLAISMLLLWRARAHSDRLLTVTLLMVNPLFLISTSLFGTFDIVAGACCFGAVVAMRRDRPVIAGIAVAVGLLLKFYPVVLIPALAAASVGRRRGAFLASSVGASALGFIVAAAIWGRSVFEPLQMGTDRPSTMTSIFRFLRGRWSPLHAVATKPDVDAMSGPLLAIGLIAVTWHVFRTRPPIAVAAALALAVTFATYRVGHPQFVQSVVVILGLIAATGGLRSPRLRAACLAYALWFGVVQLAYVWTAYDIGFPELGFAGDWAWIRDLISVPSLAVSAWLIAELAAVSGRGARGGLAARSGTTDRAAPSSPGG